MQSTIERYAIRLIAEEYPFDTQSTAFGVAVRRHIPYLQIDMFGDEQRTAGIYEELRKRDNLPKTYDVQYRLSHADGVREDFWLDKIKASLEQGHVLIICGYLHVNFLAEKAESRGWGVIEKIFFPKELVDGLVIKALTSAELDAYPET